MDIQAQRREWGAFHCQDPVPMFTPAVLSSWWPSLTQSCSTQDCSITVLSQNVTQVPSNSSFYYFLPKNIVLLSTLRSPGVIDIKLTCFLGGGDEARDFQCLYLRCFNPETKLFSHSEVYFLRESSSQPMLFFFFLTLKNSIIAASILWNWEKVKQSWVSSSLSLDDLILLFIKNH